MTVFSLEALDARSGDALLVHHGTPAEPGVMVVDGGFASTYDDRLRPRLAELQAARGLPDTEPFPIDHLVVSHVDDDHISGIVRMFRDLRDAHNEGAAAPYAIASLWHNSFPDALDAATRSAGVPPAVVAQTDEPDVVAASIANGAELRDVSLLLGLDGNPPFDGLVIGPRAVELAGDLHATVVAPDLERLEALRVKWAEEVAPDVEAGDLASAAAYVDKSVPNLSSIVVHLRSDGHTMLLTGDGRGDHTIAGLRAAGLLGPDGTCRVDVLKVPHHGSANNVERAYFETIVADHYVISGNGQHGNPEPEMLRWLTETQGDRPYTIHLTYPFGVEVLEDDRARHPRNYEVRVREPDALGIRVDLGEPPPA